MIPSSRLVMLSCVALLAGCGVQGPPEPALQLPPIDMHTELGKIDGSTVLAAPTGWTPGPTMVTPVFATPAPQLFAAMQELLAQKPRTWSMDVHPDALQASFIVRSVMFNLPDVIVVQAMVASPTTSRAVIFSRSRYDAPPLISVNKTRVTELIEALKQRFGIVTETEPPKPTPVAAPPVTPKPATPARTRRSTRPTRGGVVTNGE